MSSPVNLSQLGNNKSENTITVVKKVRGSTQEKKSVHFLRTSLDRAESLFIQNGKTFFSLCLFVFLMLSLAFFLAQGNVFVTEVIAQEKNIKEDAHTLLKNVPSLSFDQLQQELQHLQEEVSQVRKNIQSPRTYFSNAYSPLLHAENVLSMVDEVLLLSQQLAQEQGTVQNVLRDFHELPRDQLRKRYANLTWYITAHWKRIAQYVGPHIEQLQRGLDKARAEKTTFDDDQSLFLYQMIQTLISSYYMLDSAIPVLQTALGSEEKKRYMVLLQNSNEVRATGGFIGSVLFVTFQDGWMDDVSWKDVYSMDYKFQEDVPPPPGVEFINSRFLLRDANYWPDFPTSARQILWFAEREGEPHIDGVFAVNDRLVADILRIIGPITLPNAGNIQVNADNFTDVLSLLVESKRDMHSPKSPLFSFGNLFFEKLKDHLKDPHLYVQLLQSLMHNSVVAFSQDTNVQNFFVDHGLAGELSQDVVLAHELRDTALIVSTNVGGNKSDKYIEQEISHRTFFSQQGDVFSTITIDRAHTWNQQQEKAIWDLSNKIIGSEPSEPLVRVLGKGDNRDFIRLYLPRESQLISIAGVDENSVHEYIEFDKKVVSFLLVTPTGKKSQALITYKLSTVGKKTYSFTFSLPPGARPVSFLKEFQKENATLSHIKTAHDGHEGLLENATEGMQQEKVQIYQTYTSDVSL